MNITEKLLEARRLIKETPIKKGGNNSFSKYDYFTPSQVSELVNDVCQELKIVTMFSLKKDENGLYGHLKIMDTTPPMLAGDGLARIEFEMRTEMPSIKATNETQQMGGCETYTKRYMLMSAFDITDNNLDFDSQDNRPKKQELSDLANETPPQAPKAESKPSKPIEDDITLNIACASSMAELTGIWNKLTEFDKSRYGKTFTEKKLTLTNIKNK